MRLDKDKIKESLEVEDIHKIISDLGGEYHSNDNNGNPIFSTICHGGNSPNKLYYYQDSMQLQCYTNCGHISDIYDLVIKSKEIQGYNFSFPDSVRYVAEITGKNYTSDNWKEKNSDKIDDWDWINKFSKKKPNMLKELPSYNEHVLEIFLPYQNNWIDEGITKDIADKYEVKYYLKENQIIIPHRSCSGKLIGIRSRNTDYRAEQGMKYIPTTVGGKLYRHLTQQNLYGLHITKQAIQRQQRVYIFEGEKSTMKAEKYYGTDNFSVAVSGSNVSDWQIEKILSYGVRDVVIAFDNFRERRKDEPIRAYEIALDNYKKRIARIGHRIAPYARVYVLWDIEGDLLQPNDSPIDRGKKVFEKLTENKIEIKTRDVIF